MFNQGLLVIKLSGGHLYTCPDGTCVFGFIPNKQTNLPIGYTHMGLVVEGEILLSHGARERHLHAGDFFSVTGPATIQSNGLGMVSSAPGYAGLPLFGGPLEEEGRLRYIDGCTDTLLVPPLRMGDPCLNHLHFPPGVVQTLHTHPSVRVNIVYRGAGICCVPHDEQSEVALVPGSAFIMQAGTLHGFTTQNSSMDVITFHPDSDVGMTDDNHPMLNRTMVGDTSARFIDDIRTGGKE